MRKMIWLFLVIGLPAAAQELYVFSEPASGMPARSLSVKQTAKVIRDLNAGRTASRHTTELMFGVNRNLMVHTIGTFSDMYTNAQRWESVRLYGKYRFFSKDDLYRHFRLAAFAEGSYSRNKVPFSEVSVEGDQTGVQAGIIATQLLHKLAVSTTLSFANTPLSSRLLSGSTGPLPNNAFNYSLSAGYLLLPVNYTDYGQTNLNLYLELLGQNATDQRRHYVDLAPAAQLIFNSQAKLNLGYRFQLESNMARMSKDSWLISFEWLFLDALK